MNNTGSKPTFKYRPRFGLVIVCKDEDDQRRKYDSLRKRGMKVKVVAV